VSTRAASRESAGVIETVLGSPGVEGSVARGVEGVVIEGIVVAAAVWDEADDDLDEDLDFCLGWETNFATR
jgi:hypothetical protein